MRLLVVTTNRANNYGAVLQSYALRTALRPHGTVSVLDYENPFVTQSMQPVRFNFSVRGLMAAGKDLLRLRPRKRAIEKFALFNERHLHFTPRTTRTALVRGEVEEFDGYISGSDQIWNPYCIGTTGILDATYFLDFATPGALKCSCATSWGGYQPSASQLLQIKSYLSDYSSISVREREMRSTLERLTKRPVRHSLDPTLLLASCEWASLAQYDLLDSLPREYILVYGLQKRPLLAGTVGIVAARYGLPIVVIDQNPFVGFAHAWHLKDVGPEEFLALFSQATFVVTDSYHGSCFSITFKKQFFSVTEGVHASRIVSLLEAVGLSHRLITNRETLEKVPADASFEVAHERLTRWRCEELAYLEAMVSPAAAGEGPN